MQIQLVIENIEEIEEKDSSVICLKASSSISSWIIDYYLTEIFCNQIKIVENYNNYLNRCDLIDIIELFQQCQLDLVRKTIILTRNSIKNDMDRLFFEYLVELSSSCGIYDVKTKLTTVETSENLLKLIDQGQISGEQTNSKDYIKHTFCSYLSFLLDTRNERALLHCLVTSKRIGIKQEAILELQGLSKLAKNKGLTIYQILHSFLRRKELISSSQEDLLTKDDHSFDVLDKYSNGIKEFFDFIEQLRMIIEENEHLQTESNVTFRKLLELISKQLRKDSSFIQYDLIIKEMIEELCQCFQTTIPLMTCTSPIRSASSGASLASRLAYLCAKQTIDLSVFIANNDHVDMPSRLFHSSISSPIMNDQVIEVKATDHLNESVFVWQSKPMKKHRPLDLSIIHETSFESDSIDHHPIPSDNKTQSQTMIKRQPLREIDINTFNNEEIENEKIRSQNSIVFTLVSGDDKENLPVIIKKRSMASTKNEPPSKKHKKTNVKSPEAGQKMITSFFQSTI